MNTFLLPLGVVMVLFALARRFVRHRETLHERRERLLKEREEEARATDRINASIRAEEALAPLRLALKERLAEAGFHVQESNGTAEEALHAHALPLAVLERRDNRFAITKPAPSGVIRLEVRWEEKSVRLSVLQGEREARAGIFVILREGSEAERHRDLAQTEHRCAALLELPLHLPGLR